MVSGIIPSIVRFLATPAMLLAISACPPGRAVLADPVVQATFVTSHAGTEAGQKLYVVGDKTALGNWAPAKGFALKSDGKGKNGTWRGTVSLPANTAVQYKYVKWDGKTAAWERDMPTASHNREVHTPAGGHVTYSDGPFLKQ